MMYRKKTSRSRVLKVLYFLPLIGVCLAATARTQINYVEKSASSEAKVTDLPADVQEMPRDSVVMKKTLSTSIISSDVSTADGDITKMTDTLTVYGDVNVEVPATWTKIYADTTVVRVDKIRDNAIYILNGERVTYAQISALKGSDIKDIKIWKDTDAVEKFGVEGKNGVMEIWTKSKGETSESDDAPKQKDRGVSIQVKSLNGAISIDSVLVIVDGERIASSDINKIDPETIASLLVLKDVQAVIRYGSDAKHGAIVITTKKGRANDIQSMVEEVKKMQSQINSGEYVEKLRAAIPLLKESAVGHLKESWLDVDGNEFDGQQWTNLDRLVRENRETGEKTIIQIKGFELDGVRMSRGDVLKESNLGRFSILYISDNGILYAISPDYYEKYGLPKK